MRRVLVMAGVCLLALLGGATTVGAQTPAPALVTLVHAVRGLVADVYLDGQLALQTFQPERTTEPLPLPPGHHTVQVRVSGAAATSPPVLEWELDVASGDRISAVVHLAADGQPMITRYDDDVTALPPGASRVVVRHVAAAPAIDVRLSDQVLAANLANPGQGVGQVAPASYIVAVAPTGQTAPIMPPQEVALAEGTATTIYLIGSQADASLAWLAQRLDGLQSAPLGVPTGDSGLAASPSGASVVGWWPVVAVTLAAIVGAAVIQLRRRTEHVLP